MFLTNSAQGVGVQLRPAPCAAGSQCPPSPPGGGGEVGREQNCLPWGSHQRFAELECRCFWAEGGVRRERQTAGPGITLCPGNQQREAAQSEGDPAEGGGKGTPAPPRPAAPQPAPAAVAFLKGQVLRTSGSGRRARAAPSRSGADSRSQGRAMAADTPAAHGPFRGGRGPRDAGPAHRRRSFREGRSSRSLARPAPPHLYLPAGGPSC